MGMGNIAEFTSAVFSFCYERSEVFQPPAPAKFAVRRIESEGFYFNTPREFLGDVFSKSQKCFRSLAGLYVSIFIKKRIHFCLSMYKRLRLTQGMI